MIFLDTSAIYALADRADPNHSTAVQRLDRVLESGDELLTHNYVLAESIALLQTRLGMSIAAKFIKDAESFTIEWVDEARYAKDKDKLEKIAARAAELGCTRCVTLISPSSDERPYHENFEFHRRRLAEIAQILNKHQVKLGLEVNALADARQGAAFEFVHTFDELRKLASGVGVENVGVVVDLFQWHAGGGSIEEIKSLSVNQIVAVYLCDVPSDVPIG